MNDFTIKDLENLSGIKAHTIRIWEQRYSLLKPKRTETNIRYYSSEELKTILNIALLNRYGYKISNIDRMKKEEVREKILSLSQIQAQQERVINEMIQHTVDMQIENIEEVLDTYILSRGIERTITQIIFPFLERIGILWHTNHINPAQEHLIINIIRQKLIVGIESMSGKGLSKKSILLFLPEGEHHELGLLFIYYLLKSRGVKVIYVGANVPVKDVEFVTKFKKPDYLYTHLTSVAHNFHFDKFLANIHSRVADIPIIISGQVTQHYKKKLPHNIQFKRSLTEVTEYIASL